MILKFNADLTKQDIYAHGQELSSIMGFDKDLKGNRRYDWPLDQNFHVATFENPILVTDNHMISQLPSVKRDTVFALFQSYIRRTIYDGTELDFEQRKFPGVWGPNIDTLLFCKALRNYGLTGMRSAIEIGAGSGFISKYLLDHGRQLQDMTLVDINPNAIKCAQEQVYDIRARFVTGDGIDYLTDSLGNKRYDAIICNPPYIPRPQSIDDNAYEGLSLLRHLIVDATRRNLNHGGALITNFSSLSRDMCLGFCEEAKCEVKELATLEVPLKVFNVLNNKDWMAYLTSERGLKQENRRGYDFWQTISIVRITPK